MKTEVIVGDLCIGQRLAESVYSNKGAKIINEGTLLTEAITEKLLKLGIDVVTIECDDISKPEDTNNISLKLQMGILKELKDLYSKAEKGKDFKVSSLKQMVVELVESVKDKNIKYSRITEFDDAFALHSLNVGIMSLLTGIYLGYSQDKLVNVTMGALLHDIGKAVDDEKHCEAGIKLLKQCNELPTTVYVVPSQHHNSHFENCHDFSKIISVCNTFDNLLSKGLDGKDASKDIISKMGSLFEEKYVKAFFYSITM